METGKYTYDDIRIMMNNIGGMLMHLGHREEADAFSVLTHIIGYKVEGPASYLEIDEAMDNYNNQIQILKNYLDHGKARLSITPSPTDSAGK